MTPEQETKIRALAVEVELLEIEMTKNSIGFRASKPHDVALMMAEEFAVLRAKYRIAQKRLDAAIDEAANGAPDVV